ncbi:MAG TPA: zinc ABC transporter substrate-binding protein [Solirubrobacterales bacterium]|jgi:ABC-type Zn uptake system ZnuABC Zn-binding protein ZnuA/ABC-type Mn2+/Zn2+ transport system permease subunit|nr:zinc ABC transporter substrate-binding protein [Solirubrobacterales bacterium]
MLEPFQLPFVQRGLFEILILAVPAGLLGTWIVLRGLAFFSHAVGTAAFPGLVLADGLGFSAPLGAFGAAVVFSAGSALLGRREEEATDSAVAIVLVGCLAAGTILASDVFGSGANVETLLFGSLLLIDGSDLILAGVAAGLTLVVSLLLGQRWLAAGFDPAAAAPGAGGWLDLALFGLIALAIVAALSVVGALLVTALFVVPALTARLFTERMPSWQLASVVLVAVEGTVGLWLSVKTDAPPGATIAVVAGAVFAIAAGARALARARRGAPALAVAGLVVAALLVAGCGASGSGSGQLKVVATTTQIGDFVREVGGNAVAVDQILQPNTDPHEYEPRPSDVTGAVEAKLVFANGDEMDSWVDKIVSDSGSDAEIVDLGAIVPERRPGESSGAAKSARYDPHWWHDPRNAEAAVAAIERHLAAADPSHRQQFKRNATAYIAKLRALDVGIARCMDSVPASRRKLVTDHDAFGYFADRYGIEVVGAVIPSQTTQAQPSAKDLSALAKLIEREHVKAIFPESSLSPKVAEAIASQTGASSSYTLYGDTLGPEGSSGATYLTMEAANANAMVRGFTGGRRGCQPLP